MQILVMQASGARTRSYTINGWQLALGALVTLLASMVLCALVYQFVLQKAVRENWPVVGQVVQAIMRGQSASRDRYLRENLDAMATKVGELQAKLVRLEAMSDRVASLAGVRPDELRERIGAPANAASAASAALTGSGGPYVPLSDATTLLHVNDLDELNRLVSVLDEQTDARVDDFTYIESHLFEKRLSALMVPSTAPVDGPVGSGFGYRTDPFTGRAALHTGLDFPSAVGTPIRAAAGGVVIASQVHPQYGNMVEIDHGNGLVTRYGHASRLMVRAGDLVKRGQVIALVGTTGRSTGPHLHFEVLVQGVQQDPARFLAGHLPPGADLTARAYDASR